MGQLLLHPHWQGTLERLFSGAVATGGFNLACPSNVDPAVLSYQIDAFARSRRLPVTCKANSTHVVVRLDRQGRVS